MKPALCPCLLALALVFTGRVALAAPTVPAASAASQTSAASANTTSAASGAPAAKPVKAKSDLPKLPIKIGMEYGKARKRLLAQGWRPFRDPNCLRNLSGDDKSKKEWEQYWAIPKNRYHNDDYTLCRRIPELSICSVDGYCNMYFKKNGKLLNVGTYDSAAFWDNEVQVSGWRFVRQREE
jgi:hypothetical protein